MSSISAKLFGTSTLVLVLTLLYHIWTLDVSVWLSLTTAEEHFVCKVPAYKVRFLMYDPLIVHLEGFITLEERNHLLEISENQFQTSLTLHPNGTDTIDTSIRTSRSAHLDDDDPVVDCIKTRVAEFQGYHNKDEIETLQATRYQKGQQYGEHFDWFESYQTPFTDGMNRITTFFGILKADCEKCGTRFTKIAVDWKQEDEKWCDIVECEETEYLTVKSIPGNVLFWKNLQADGRGDMQTMHAGLPLQNGVKVGLNIWSNVPQPEHIQDEFAGYRQEAAQKVVDSQ